MNLIVLYGSRACEHDVSIITAVQAMDNADKSKYDITPVYIDKKGRWFTGEALRKMDFYTHFDEKKVTPCRILPGENGGKAQLVSAKAGLFGGIKTICEIDCALLAFHGMNGEDGTMQGLLELYDVPYTSAGVLGSATGMDKIAMKLIYKGCGLPVLDMCWFERGDWAKDRNAIIEKVEKEVGYPAFVKPANLGSSIGISVAADRDALRKSLDTAFSFAEVVLVERAITNLREINCSVLGDRFNAEASECEEPMAADEILSFADKYIAGAKDGGAKGMASVKRKIPAPIPEEQRTEIREMAVKAFKALGCSGVARIDFMIDGDENKLYLNEINTIPGSLSFYLWEPLGVKYADLLDRMIELGMKRHRARKNLTFSFESNVLSGIHLGGAKGGKL